MRLHGKYNTAQVAFLGVYLAVSLILSYIETLIPVVIGIPGIKLGLANLCVLLILYTFGIPEAILINICRIIISGFLFGNMSMIMYSLAGALLSFLVMLIFKKNKLFSIAGVSLLGGVMHNIGQCIVASFAVSDIRVAFYLPILIISGAVTGYIIGMVCNLIIPNIDRIFHQEG